MSFLFIFNVLKAKFFMLGAFAAMTKKLSHALQAKFTILAWVLLTFRRIFVFPSAGSIVQDE
jgi:hypothetical protein